MWWASKTGIAEADEYKKDPTSQSGTYLPNDTDHLYDLHIPTFNKKTLQRDKHRLSVERPHEWFDDDVGNDGTMIFKLEEAKSQNNLSPKYWSHKVVLDNPSASVLRLPTYADGAPCSHDVSDIGFGVVNTLTQGRYLVAAIRKKLLCQCGCRGWCTLFPLFEMLGWSCSAMAEGMHPPGRHDGNG